MYALSPYCNVPVFSLYIFNLTRLSADLSSCIAYDTVLPCIDFPLMPSNWSPTLNAPTLQAKSDAVVTIMQRPYGIRTHATFLHLTVAVSQIIILCYGIAGPERAEKQLHIHRKKPTIHLRRILT